MRFLSDILAKAGLIVDGAVVFNSTANGQTPASNDNSTKLATTAWVRSFVQPYTLPIASATILGGVKVGTGLAIDPVSGVLSLSGGSIALKSTETFTATQGQSIFTITNGYTVGLIDVFLNGVYLSPSQITATNGTTITLNDPAIVGDIIDVIITTPLGEGSVATTDQIAEGVTNLYYTDTRARAAISLTTTSVSGAATYNILTGQLNIPHYQGLVPAGGVAGQILSKIDGSDYNTQWLDEAPASSYTSQLKHRVKSSQAINKGQAVYVSSADGTNMIVSKASNASEATSSKTMGLLESTVAINGTANVITEGLLAGLDTTGATAAGDPVWLGTDGNLIYGLVSKPVAPAHLVFIGVVTRRNANNGEIFIKVQNGFEFGELHDYVQNGVQNNYVISYESATSLYKPKSIATLLGYAPANAATTITINGTTYDLSANRSWDIAGGVTSFNTRTGAITLTSADVTGALGYTPYNATNPSGYITASALSGYLPLSGGTLTGALSGTSATFSGNVQIGSGTGLSQLKVGSGTGYTGIVLSNDATHYSWLLGSQYNISNAFEITPSTAIGGSTFTTPVFQITNTGAATFSSSVRATTLVLTGGTGGINFTSSTTITNTASSGFTAIYANGGGIYLGGSASVNHLSIASTGAATFSSSVTAGGLISGSASIYQTNASGSIASNRFETYNGGATQMQFLFPASGSVAFNNGSDKLLLSQEGNLLLTSGTTVYNSTGDFYLRAGTSGALVLGAGGTNGYMRITSGGVVLVNQTSLSAASAGQKMQVATDMLTTGSLAGYFFENRSGGVTASTNWAGWYYSGSTIRLYNGSSDILSITASNGAIAFPSSITATNGAFNQAGPTSLYLSNTTLSAGSSSGTTGLYFGDNGSGINILTREKVTVNTAYTVIYSEYGYGNAVKAAQFFNGATQLFGNLAGTGATFSSIVTANGDIRTTGLRLNQGTNNQGHRIYSRTMDVSAYTSQTSMRFTVAGGNSVQFQYEITFHATRLSGNLVEIWYLRYTGGVAYDTAGNPNERWWDLREQAGNGIAGVGRNNNTGNLEITNTAFDTSCRLTVCVKITCNNWDAVTVSFS